MHRFCLALLVFLCSSSLYAMFAGNPADPALMEKGIVSNISRVSFRLGFMEDWVYKQRFQEEFLIFEKTRTKNQLTTISGMATINLIRRLDLYTLLGASRMQVDDQIFSKRAFSWCVGSKLVFLKHKNWYFGSDVKYFETDQKPKYFVIGGEPFNIVNQYRSKYFDVQASLGMTYKISFFAPYVNATYIYTHISPEPPVVAVRFPDEDAIADIEIPSLICRKKWGMALGFSLVDISKAALAFEWRLINQNGINVNGELRF